MSESKNRGRNQNSVSLVIPAKNEAGVIGTLITELRDLYPGSEIIVVNDGSSDDTDQVAANAGARVITHPYSKGNGSAVKTGARLANGDIIVFMDGDGQHQAADVDQLLAKLDEGFDMAVGARSSKDHASGGRRIANNFYNWLATRMTGHNIADLTSGFRAVWTDKFREFLHLLPNGFSYPTTSTMAFFRAGYSVAYVPIKVRQRVGKSHIRPLKDGMRFLIIIFKVGTLYSPLKIFLPFSALFFTLGLGYYIYTYFAAHAFTNMGALLFSVSIIVFLIGLVSEQITALQYRR